MLRAWRTPGPVDPALSGRAAVRSGIQCGALARPFLPSGVRTSAQKSGCSAHHVIGEYKSNGSWSRTSAFCEKVHFVRRATVLTAVGNRASFAPLAMRGVRAVDGPKASPIFRVGFVCGHGFSQYRGQRRQWARYRPQCANYESALPKGRRRDRRRPRHHLDLLRLALLAV